MMVGEIPVRVSSQVAAITVDVAAQRLAGWTELLVDIPEQSASPTSLSIDVGPNVSVSRVTVEQVEARWSLTPPPPFPSASALESCAQSEPEAFDRALAGAYAQQLCASLHSPLVVELPEADALSGARLARVRVWYSAHPDGEALVFTEEGARASGELLGAQHWLPCVCDSGARQATSLRLTVRAWETAAAGGRLLRRSWADRARRWQTFHYELARTAPESLGFAVGKFEAVEAQGVTLLAPPSCAALLQPTAAFVALLLSLYEQSTTRALPVDGLSLVFLPPTLQSVPVTPTLSAALAGLCLLSPEALVDPASLDASLAARWTLARALAGQWFGQGLRPARPEDAWLLEGLASWLAEQYVFAHLGRNELLYRRWLAQQEAVRLDDGLLPPLAPDPVALGRALAREKAAQDAGEIAEASARPRQLLSPALAARAAGLGPALALRDPSALFAARAAAVVVLLERRAGEDLFRKHVQNCVAAALAVEGRTEAEGEGARPMDTDGEPGSVPSLPPPSPEKVPPGASPTSGAQGALEAQTFVLELGRLGGFRKEVPAFFQRWIFHAGAPTLWAGCVYHSGPLKRSVLELALRQQGPPAARAGALAAEQAAETEGGGVGVLKILVREAEAPVEHPLHVGAAALRLAELKVNPEVKRVASRRGPRRRRPEGEEEDPGPVPGAAPEPGDAQSPLQWVRVDPQGEWLCRVFLTQPWRCWAAALQRSRDLISQCEAARALGGVGGGGAPRVAGEEEGPQGWSAGALRALKDALEAPGLCCHARCEAAGALGALRSAAGEPLGLPALLEYYKARYWDEATDAPRPAAFADASELLVAAAAVRAIGAAREADGSSPLDALLFLLLALEQFRALPGTLDAAPLLAALCAAVGAVRAEGLSEAAAALLERFLRREAALPSPARAVGVACLRGLPEQALGGGGGDLARRVEGLVQGALAARELGSPLRAAAAAAAARLEAARLGGGGEGGVWLACRGLAEKLDDRVEKGMAIEESMPIAKLEKGMSGFKLEKGMPSSAQPAKPPPNRRAALIRAYDTLPWAVRMLRLERSRGDQGTEVSAPALQSLLSALARAPSLQLRHWAFLAAAAGGPGAGAAPALCMEEVYKAVLARDLATSIEGDGVAHKVTLRLPVPAAAPLAEAREEREAAPLLSTVIKLGFVLPGAGGHGPGAQGSAPAAAPALQATPAPAAPLVRLKVVGVSTLAGQPGEERGE